MAVDRRDRYLQHSFRARHTFSANDMASFKGDVMPSKSGSILFMAALCLMRSLKGSTYFFSDGSIILPSEVGGAAYFQVTEVFVLEFVSSI